MADILKLNDAYIDSSGIIHNQELLNDVLAGKMNMAGNLTKANNWNNISKLGFYTVNLWIGSGGANYPPVQFTGLAIITTFYQLCFDMTNNKIRSRRLEGTTWESWSSW